MENYYKNCYDERCECCRKDVTISGGYIGMLVDIYCNECGYESEYCERKCKKVIE